MSKNPKMKQNSAGELVTQGRWISGLQYEQQMRQFYSKGYEEGAHTALNETMMIEGVVRVAHRLIAAFNSIAMCSNGPETRLWAARIMQELTDVRKRLQELYDKGGENIAIGHDPDVFQDIMDVSSEMIELLSTYVDSTGKDSIAAHAELRAWAGEENDILNGMRNERSFARKKNGPDHETEAAVNRVRDLMRTSKLNLSKACEQVGQEMQMEPGTVRQAYYRRKTL